MLAVLLRQAPIITIANIVNAAIVAAVLATVAVSPWQPLLWVCLVLVLTFARWRAAAAWRRDPAGTDVQRALNSSTIGSALSGLLWGGGLALMFPAALPQQVLVAFVLGGMAAGAVVSLPSHLPAMYAYILLSVVPVAARFLMGGDLVNMAMGTMLLVYCVSLAMIGRNSNATLRRALTLQRDKDGLIAELKGVLATLEQRVEERTRQFKEANDRLSLEICERQRAEAAERIARRAAERANDEKTRFLAAASHDLRQPLQAMRLYQDLLTRRLDQQAPISEVVERLGASMEAAERLLGALMDISTLDAGTVQAHLSAFPVQDILDPLVNEMEPQAAAAGMELRVRRSRHRIVSDSVLLSRILRNLLTNAIRHGGNGVLLGCRPRGDNLRIEVWDRGPGVPADQLDAIFEDFVRLAGEEGAQCEGLGLGLSIVKRMAQLLDHPIGVRSWPGKGSVFHIDVPLAKG